MDALKASGPKSEVEGNYHILGKKFQINSFVVFKIRKCQKEPGNKFLSLPSSLLPSYCLEAQGFYMEDQWMPKQMALFFTEAMASIWCTILFILHFS